MNKLQKRELRKKRHARQQYLKYEAPLDRFERALENLNGHSQMRCPSVSPTTGRQCIHKNLHTGKCCEDRAGLRTWDTNAVSLEGL